MYVLSGTNALSVWLVQMGKLHSAGHFSRLAKLSAAGGCLYLASGWQAMKSSDGWFTALQLGRWVLKFSSPQHLREKNERVGHDAGQLLAAV